MFFVAIYSSHFQSATDDKKSSFRRACNKLVLKLWSKNITEKYKIDFFKTRSLIFKSWMNTHILANKWILTVFEIGSPWASIVKMASSLLRSLSISSLYGSIRFLPILAGTRYNFNHNSWGGWSQLQRHKKCVVIFSLFNKHRCSKMGVTVFLIANFFLSSITYSRWINIPCPETSGQNFCRLHYPYTEWLW